VPMRSRFFADSCGSWVPSVVRSPFAPAGRIEGGWGSRLGWAGGNQTLTLVRQPVLRWVHVTVGICARDAPGGEGRRVGRRGPGRWAKRGLVKADRRRHGGRGKEEIAAGGQAKVGSAQPISLVERRTSEVWPCANRAGGCPSSHPACRMRARFLQDSCGSWVPSVVRSPFTPAGRIDGGCGSRLGSAGGNQTLTLVRQPVLRWVHVTVGIRARTSRVPGGAGASDEAGALQHRLASRRRMDGA
jgi:hypothetical protein